MGRALGAGLEARGAGVTLVEAKDLADRGGPLAREQAGVEVVYALSGMAPEPGADAPPVALASLALARQAGARRFVLALPAAMLGRIDDPPAHEGCEPRPAGQRLEAAAAEERAVLASLATGDIEGVVARCAEAYGPGLPFLAEVLRAVARGRFVLPGRGKGLEHPIHLDDLVDGLSRCGIEPKAAGRLYHLGGAEYVELKDLARLMALAAGEPAPGKSRPYWIARLRLGAEVAGAFRVNRAYDISRARLELGFSPQVTLPAGLARSVKQLRQDGRL